MHKPIVFSAAQPSGSLTIGNYIGAIQKWADIQYNYRCLYCIVDLHAVTTFNNVNQLRRISLDTLALYLACGIDPNNNVIFLQSHIPEHSQLHWLLSCCTHFGELNRMVQFKNRLIQNKGEINVGLFNYPILMASDILLYQTNLVPVGEDQKQHLELVRDIADRFNRIYGSVFTIPEMLISAYGSKIMSLLNPTKKMSKSDCNSGNIIGLLDDIEVIKTKISRAVTDSDYPPVIKYNPVGKPGISNLLVILSSFSRNSIEYLEKFFQGKTYFQLKNEVFQSISLILKKLQDRYYLERANEDKLYRILYNGSKSARVLANLTLKKVCKVMGFVNIDGK